MCGENLHFIVCLTHFNVALCDNGKITECLPSWSMYDQLMQERINYFTKADNATSKDEKIRFKRLEVLFNRKARDILNQLKK